MQRTSLARSTRSAAISGYGDLARVCGLDPVRMVAAAGLPLACLGDPDLRIPVVGVETLLEASAARARTPDFGLRLAEMRSLANLGPLGLLAREQPTLRGVIDMLAQHIAVHNEALSLRIEPAGALTILHTGLWRSGNGPAVQSIELLVAATVRMLRRLTGEAFAPLSIHFRHTPPASTASHHRVLGLVPEFSADFEGIVLETIALETIVPAADPLAATQLARHIADLSRSRHDDPVRTVHELLILLLPTGNASADRVAQHLGITRRTLHRRLAGEGTTFTRLLDETRRELVALHSRDRSRSLTEIAGLVGYASLSAFSRWRHR